jgi:hypothetical protein
MKAIRNVISIIMGSPGDLAEERARFYGIVAKLMARMSRGRKVC